MQKRSSGGCGSFLFLLFFVFLVLKLAGSVDWSWWWVTAPIWLPAALVMAGLVLLTVTGVGAYKIVARVLRRQNAQRSDRPKADVLEAEGSEVRTPSNGAQQSLALPPTSETDSPSG